MLTNARLTELTTFAKGDQDSLFPSGRTAIITPTWRWSDHGAKGRTTAAARRTIVPGRG